MVNMTFQEPLSLLYMWFAFVKMKLITHVLRVIFKQKLRKKCQIQKKKLYSVLLT